MALDKIEYVASPNEELAKSQEMKTLTDWTTAEIRREFGDDVKQTIDLLPPPIVDIAWEEGAPEGNGQVKEFLEKKIRKAEYMFGTPTKLILSEKQPNNRTQQIWAQEVDLSGLTELGDEISLTGAYFTARGTYPGSLLLQDKETTPYTIRIIKTSTGYALRFSLSTPTDLETAEKAPEVLEETDTFARMLDENGELVKDDLVRQAGIGKETGQLYVFTNEPNPAGGDDIYTEYLKTGYQHLADLKTAGETVVLPQPIEREGRIYKVVMQNSDGKLVAQLQEIIQGLTDFSSAIEVVSPEKASGSTNRTGKYMTGSKTFTLYADSTQSRALGSLVLPPEREQLPFGESLVVGRFVPLRGARAVEVSVRNDAGKGVFVVEVLDETDAGFDPKIQETGGDIPGERSILTKDMKIFMTTGDLEIQVIDQMGKKTSKQLKFTDVQERQALKFPQRTTKWRAFALEGSTYEFMLKRNSQTGRLVGVLKLLQGPTSTTSVGTDPDVISLPRREVNTNNPLFEIGEQAYPISFYRRSATYVGETPLNPIQETTLKKLYLSDEEDLVSWDALINDKQIFAFWTPEEGATPDTKRFEFTLNELQFLSSKPITVNGRGVTGAARTRNSFEHTFSLTKNDGNDEPWTIIATFVPMFDQQGQPQNRKMMVDVQLVGSKFGIEKPSRAGKAGEVIADATDAVGDVLTQAGETLQDRYDDIVLAVMRQRTIPEEKSPTLNTTNEQGQETSVDIVKYDQAVFPMAGVEQEEVRPFSINRDEEHPTQFILRRDKEGRRTGDDDITRVDLAEVKDGEVVGIDGFGGDGLLQVAYNIEEQTLQFFLKPPCELTKAGCGVDSPEAKEKLQAGFSWPVDGIKAGTRSGQLFLAPRDGGIRRHMGIDIGAQEGTPFEAVLEGKVIRANAKPTDKNGKVVPSYIVVEHQLAGGKVYRTKYIHGKNYKVKVGDDVKKGDQLGEVSDVGSPGEYHLHFEVLEQSEKPFYPDPGHKGWGYLYPGGFFDPAVSGIPTAAEDPRYPTEEKKQEKITDGSKYPDMAADVNEYNRGKKGVYQKFQKEYASKRLDGLKRGIYPAGYTEKQFHEDLATLEAGETLPRFEYVAPAKGQKKEEYVKNTLLPKLLPFLQPLCKQYNMRPSILIAQMILESNRGFSGHLKKDYNYTGMKPSGARVGPVVSMKTREEVDGKRVDTKANFKAYVSPEHGVMDLIRRHERKGIKLGGNVSRRQAAKNVDKSGYATDGSYADKVIKIVDDLDLHEYDKQIFDKEEMEKVEKTETVLAEKAGTRKNVDNGVEIGLNRSTTDYEISSYQNSFIGSTDPKTVSSNTTGNRRIGQDGNHLYIYTYPTQKPIKIKSDDYEEKKGSKNIFLLPAASSEIVINKKKYGLVVKLQKDGEKRKASFGLTPEK